jgi:hypothetical protein
MPHRDIHQSSFPCSVLVGSIDKFAAVAHAYAGEPIQPPFIYDSS